MRTQKIEARKTLLPRKIEGLRDAVMLSPGKQWGEPYRITNTVWKYAAWYLMSENVRKMSATLMVD
jgi:hypothetical protein